MGTNYYQRTNICKYCNRYEEKHIGKSSGGWQFIFRGYSADEHRPIICSFEDWKTELKNGKIFTEYGEEISFDNFVRFVEDKKIGKFNDKPNLNHYDHGVKEGYNTQYDWKDSKNHSFTSSEFS